MPPTEDADAEWKRKIQNYESDDYMNEDDFEPGLEGFLHNVKR